MATKRNEKPVTLYQAVRENKEICAFLRKGNENLGVMGFTDHSQAHCGLVAERGAEILRKFEYPEHDIELVKIAGFMHDIGNAVNRTHHAEYGALLANELLKEIGLPLEDRITVVSAIGHHDESTGGAMDPISAALIIADKTDVRRNRVREKEQAAFDIHDRVNYAVEQSALHLDVDAHTVTLVLTIDNTISSVMDYFEIFMERMLLCRRAAGFFDLKFHLTINNTSLL